MQKKRHHYVPKAYLNAFRDEIGMLRVYRKNDPSKGIHLAPTNIAFRKYYYSQPIPFGQRDNNKLEDFFSVIEGAWPQIVARLERRENVNDCLEHIFQFMALQRARVPASRDATESILADSVMATVRAMDAVGLLPPKPAGLEDLLNHVSVAVDPHQSIHAMVAMIRGAATVFDRVGICALHNTTSRPFLTSDNPVAWFDPSVDDDNLCPYVPSPSGPVALLFPVSPSLMIYGHSSLKERFGTEGLLITEAQDEASVVSINRQICRFAYDAVFAQREGQEELIQANSDRSPVHVSRRESVDNRQRVVHGMAFGQRRNKPKWRRNPRDC